MIVLAKHEVDRNLHIITSIDGEAVRSITYYNTPKGRKTVRDWNHQLDELGFKSAEQYVDIMTKRGFKEVKQA